MLHLNGAWRRSPFLGQYKFAEIPRNAPNSNAKWRIPRTQCPAVFRLLEPRTSPRLGQLCFLTASIAPKCTVRKLSDEWCPESDLNQRPTAYEAVALPLSYQGTLAVVKRAREARLPEAGGT
jgi:hypothetical protein